MSLKPTSFYLLERENNTNFITWIYPTINEDQKILIERTCFSKILRAADLYFYIRNDKYWIYIKQFAENNKRKAIIITSLSYQPNLYKVLCDLFIEKCLSGSNGADLVKIYLQIFISCGICINEKQRTFLHLNDFPLETNLKDLLKQFGIEIILLYNGLLLKRQILVFHPDVEILQQSLNTITKLVPHRKEEDILQPLVQNQVDLRKKSSLFLNGSINSHLLTQHNLFDVLVNLQSHKITISPQAKDLFHMSSLHKEIAYFFMQTADSEATESKVLNEISRKTIDVYNYLKNFESTQDGETTILMQNIESKIKNNNLRKFIINLAIAENIKILV